MTLYVENHSIVIHIDGSIYQVRFEYDDDGDLNNNGAVIIEERGAGETNDGFGPPMITENQWRHMRKAVDQLFAVHRYRHL